MPERQGNGAASPRSPRFPSSKFSAPRPVGHLVPRPRLHDYLDHGQQARLTLLVASPGAGKSMLLADWVAAHPERPTAWLSCDAADSDPVRFGAAIIEALRRSQGQPGLGEDARQLLSLDGEVSADVMAALADDLERSDGTPVLVIDDFHLTSPGGAGVLALLLDCRPDSLLVMVSTRVDPELRLHRMRANHELVEIRDQDLSFSADETRQFLSALGVPLDDRHVAAVQERSEGWAAGLQMAGLAIQHAPDHLGAAGRVELHRHTVAGYFLEEVLYRQPPEVVEFMLTTCILDDLSVPACVALCGPGSARLLEQVYRNHLFVAIVDDQAGTYRYHHLIREVLQAELHTRDPARERSLHEVAASHLFDTGRVGPAARHLLAAGDPAAAFRLLSQRVIVANASDPTLGSALDLDEVQPELFGDSPEILAPLAAELLLRGAFERGSRAFALADALPVDADQQPELAVQLTVVRALHSFLVGELDQSLAQWDRLRRSIAPPVGLDDWLVALDAGALYSHAFLGDFPQARRLAEAIAAHPITPPAGREVLCQGVMSQIALAQGWLDEAGDIAIRALDAAGRLGFDRHYFAFTARRTAALLALERRDLATATSLTELSLGIVSGGRPLFEFLAQLDRARIWAATGNPDEALASLPAARAALRSDRSVLLAQADEIEARLRLALGDRRGATSLAERLPGDRRLVVSAMIALASENARAAQDLVHDMAPEPATVRAALESRLLQASVALVQNSHQTPRLVREVLAVTHRYGFVQTVLDTAPRLVQHLVSDSAGYPDTDNLAALVNAGLEDRKPTVTRSQTGRLPDPLTDAELRVLEKLPQRLSYADIAYELHLSLNTVKTHLRHTYMKLDVTSRSAAVKRAASLGFL
jgi:LuxR family transcriptional regulator, maltose regulon positive regulatory protein